MDRTSAQVPVTVLAVEDEPAIRRLFEAAFLGTEFRMLEATNGEEGLSILATKRPDLVLLDLGLPNLDGLEFIRQARAWSSIPIIVVSALGDEDRKVNALEQGADDYVTKPFSVSELLARMRVALRHARALDSRPDEPVVEFGDVVLDLARREVTKKGERVRLSPIEYKLLSCLARHAGKVVTQKQILTNVWGDEYSEDAQYLRVYMGYLRKKLEDDPSRPQLLLTEPRIGYRLRA